MKRPSTARPFVYFLVTVLFCLTPYAFAQEPTPRAPDKALCARMLRWGQQSYERGRYAEAKGYFRQAVQADPSSMSAWRYYDRATILALAHKVEKDASLTAPDVSVRHVEPHGTTAPVAPPPPQAVPAKKKAFVIEEDEGC